MRQKYSQMIVEWSFSIQASEGTDLHVTFVGGLHQDVTSEGPSLLLSFSSSSLIFCLLLSLIHIWKTKNLFFLFFFCFLLLKSRPSPNLLSSWRDHLDRHIAWELGTQSLRIHSVRRSVVNKDCNWSRGTALHNNTTKARKPNPLSIERQSPARVPNESWIHRSTLFKKRTEGWRSCGPRFWFPRAHELSCNPSSYAYGLQIRWIPLRCAFVCPGRTLGIPIGSTSTSFCFLPPTFSFLSSLNLCSLLVLFRFSNICFGRKIKRKRKIKKKRKEEEKEKKRKEKKQNLGSRRTFQTKVKGKGRLIKERAILVLGS